MLISCILYGRDILHSFAVVSFSSGPFDLKKSVASLKPNQFLDIPPGNYTSTDCGIDVVVDNVLIQASSRKVEIDCSGFDRHFIIHGSNVTIEGLSLVNGASQTGRMQDPFDYQDTSDGGCLLIYGNHTIVRDTSFVNCQSSENGGAISVAKMNAVVRLEAVSIQGSMATHGGGVWSCGLLALENCTLAFNNATLHGGAVFVQGPNSRLTARKTVISYNSAYGGYGGGICMMLRNVSVTHCPDQVTVVPDGSGAILSDCLVRGNWAANYGGAIFSQDGFTLLLEGKELGTRVDENAAARGGAICTFFTPTLSVLGNVRFTGNVGTDAVGHGGALYTKCGSHIAIVGAEVRFEDNIASIANQGYGGAVFIADFSTMSITGNVSFIANRAEAGYGGAIFFEWEASGTISGNVRFVGNIAIGGGAISNAWDSSSDISGDVQFIGNEAEAGAALDVESGSSVRITGRVSFAHNRGIHVSDVVSVASGIPTQAPSTGGAIYIERGTVSCSGSVAFENNTADQGGGIFANAGAELTMGDSVSVRGCAAASGGGFYIQSSSARLGGQTVVDGNVAESGGGLLARLLNSPSQFDPTDALANTEARFRWQPGVFCEPKRRRPICLQSCDGSRGWNVCGGLGGCGHRTLRQLKPVRH